MRQLVNLIFFLPSFLWADTWILARISPAGGVSIVSQDGAKTEVMPGSLFKPFLAAYLLDHHILPPEQRFYCAGEKQPPGEACWLQQGHRHTDLARALSVSCNAYFYRAGRLIDRREDFFNELTVRWSLPPGLDSGTPDSLLGDNLRKKVPLQSIFFAYVQLFSEIESRPLYKPILEGLSVSPEGTIRDAAELLHKRPDLSLVYGKTGTAGKGRKASGMAVLLVSRKNMADRFIVIFQLDGTMGAKAAARAAQIAIEKIP